MIGIGILMDQFINLGYIGYKAPLQYKTPYERVLVDGTGPKSTTAQRQEYMIFDLIEYSRNYAIYLFKGVE